MLTRRPVNPAQAFAHRRAVSLRKECEPDMNDAEDTALAATTVAYELISLMAAANLMHKKDHRND